MRGYFSWAGDTTMLTAANLPRTPELIARAIQAMAVDLDGLSAEKAEYLAFIASPGSTDPALRASMARMSGCALTVLALWRHLGVPNQELWESYRIGKAVSWLVAVAKANGVWRTSPSDLRHACVGDTYLVASPEHVFTCVGDVEVDERGLQFMALHGGGKTATGFQLIQRKLTRLDLKGGKLLYGAKSVVGVARGQKLKVTRGAKLPVGWNAADGEIENA